MKIKFLILIVLSCFVAQAQRLEIERVNIDNYPNIRAEVTAYDAAGDEYRLLNQNPITVTEDGELKNTVFQNCETDVRRYSLIVVADISGSMELSIDGQSANKPNRRIDALQRSLRTLVQRMNPSNSEFSLLLFAGQSEVFIEFSQNTDSILTLLQRDILTKTSTDFNSAFTGFDSFNRAAGVGAIPYSANAKWKPVILFFSDGEHNKQVDGDVRAQQILTQANNAEALVFSAQFGGSTPGSISTIVGGTGGSSYGSLNTEAQVQQAFADILQEVERNPSALPPCEVEWVTDCDQNEITIEGLVNGNVVSASTTYVVPDNRKPSLEIDNRNIEILNNGNVQITATARNSDILLNGANFSQAGFDFVDDLNNLNLQRDIPTILELEHIDNVADCTPTDITLISNACFGNDLQASSGFLSTEDVSITGATPGIASTLNAVFFNNNFCRDVTITNVRIENGDSPLFSSNFGGPINVVQGTSVNLDFEYLPQTPGSHSADLLITVDGIDYPGIIRGSSSGLPEIATNIQTPFDNVVCDETSQLIIEISNPGPVPLTVSDIQIDDNTHFRLQDPANTSFSIAENNTATQQIIVIFDPQSEGVKNATLTISNDSDNEPSTVIPLNAKELDLEYQIASSSQIIDLGIICPGENVPFDISIESIGEADGIVTIDPTTGDISLTGGNQLDFTGGDNDLTKNASFTTLTEGAFDYDLPVTDDCGNSYGTLKVIGEVIQATTEYDASEYDYGTNTQVRSFESDINSATQFTLTLVNNFSRDIENIQVNVINDLDAVFQVIGNDPTATANGNYDVTIEYTPTEAKIYSLELSVSAEVNGNLCLNRDLVPLTAGTSLASAEFIYEDAEALIGQEFQIDVPNILPENNFFGVGINTAELEVSVQTNMVASTDGVGSRIDADRTIYSYTVDVDNPAPLNFIALNPGDLTMNQSQIEFNFLATEPAGLADITANPVTFNLIRAKADIGANEFTQKPGVVFDISINSTDFEGVEPDFHRAINGKMKFNASLLAPVNNTPRGNITLEGETNFRVIDFTIDLTGQNAFGGKNLITSITNASLSYEFMALLGNQASTDIELFDLSSEVGEIEFDNVILGTFNLDPTCLDDNGNVLRYYDPFVENPISINGNPSNNTASVNVNLIEDGEHNISLLDINGNTLEVMMNGYNSHGDYSFTINSSELPNGVYLVLLTTPTQKFSEEIIISH